MKKNSVSEFELEKQDFKIRLKRGVSGSTPTWVGRCYGTSATRRVNLNFTNDLQSTHGIESNCRKSRSNCAASGNRNKPAWRRTRRRTTRGSWRKSAREPGGR